MKFIGTQCPSTHLKSYYNKMEEVVHDEKLLIYFSQDSWYTRLDNMKIQKWKDLVDAFIKQYKYNIDIAPERSILQDIVDKEYIREYV